MSDVFSCSSLEALADTETGMRAVGAFGEINADRVQPELGHVEAQPEPIVAAVGEFTRVSHDAVCVGIK